MTNINSTFSIIFSLGILITNSIKPIKEQHPEANWQYMYITIDKKNKILKQQFEEFTQNITDFSPINMIKNQDSITMQLLLDEELSNFMQKIIKSIIEEHYEKFKLLSFLKDAVNLTLPIPQFFAVLILTWKNTNNESAWEQIVTLSPYNHHRHLKILQKLILNLDEIHKQKLMQQLENFILSSHKARILFPQIIHNLILLGFSLNDIVLNFFLNRYDTEGNKKLNLFEKLLAIKQELIATQIIEFISDSLNREKVFFYLKQKQKIYDLFLFHLHIGSIISSRSKKFFDLLKDFPLHPPPCSNVFDEGEKMVIGNTINNLFEVIFSALTFQKDEEFNKFVIEKFNYSNRLQTYLFQKGN